MRTDMRTTHIPTLRPQNMTLTLTLILTLTPLPHLLPPVKVALNPRIWTDLQNCMARKIVIKPMDRTRGLRVEGVGQGG